jgi:hypothetical protein
MYMKSNVKKIGNQTEKDFANLMFNKGWWVHILNDKVNGQPFDIIMAKNSAVWFLDVKNVSGKNYFLHNRIEPNQKSSMKMLMKRGISNVGFVICFDGEWYLLKYSKIDFDKPRTLKRDCIRVLI